MNTIQPATIKNRLQAGDKPCMIDVREAEEVAAGMIPGAWHIPLGELPARLDEIPRTDEVILICRSGHRSGMACEYLQAAGFIGVKNMVGGMLAWNELD